MHTEDVIAEQYTARYPRSRALHEQSKKIFSRGVPHDAWYVLPFPLYIESARGSRVWDADGYEYIDYFGGHGGLVLGHAHPVLTQAVKDQIVKGTHYGGCSALQIEWGNLIKEYFPAAEKIEFTNSGTEAIMLAIRLARAFTGKNKIVRFRGQMGGWYDALAADSSGGLLPAVAENTITVPINNEILLEQALAAGDTALVICEAVGAFTGVTGIAPAFYKIMQELTREYGALLLFDEVVTAFRYPPGGAQQAKGAAPDLTVLGKMVTGGIAGAGCVLGRADVLELLEFVNDRPDRRVSHPGTFNANPLCAASGIAAMKTLLTGIPQKKAEVLAGTLREGFRKALNAKNIDGCVFGESSVYHVYFGPCPLRKTCAQQLCLNDDKDTPPAVARALHIHLALNGIHTAPRELHGFISAAHSPDDIDKTVTAFASSAGALQEAGLIK